MKLLFVLLSLAIALPTHEQSLAAVRELWWSKQAFVQKITTQSDRRKFHTLTAEEDCAAAQQHFQELAGTCLDTTVGGIFADNGTMTPEQVTTAINNYCTTGGCHAQMEAAAQNLTDKCGAIWKAGCASASPCDSSNYPCAPDGATCGIDLQHIRDIRMILNLFCVKAPGTDGTDKFCVPSFYKFVNDNTQDLQARLTNGCDLCTLKIFTVWSQIEPFEAAINFLNLGTICLKRDNKFCVLHKQQLDAADTTWGAQCSSYNASGTCGAAARGCRWKDDECEDDWTGAKGKEKTDLICHQCTTAYIRRLVVLIDLMDRFNIPEDPGAEAPRSEVKKGLLLILFFQSGVCSTDLSGSLCLPQLQAQTADFSVDACNALAEVKQNTGCCAATVVGFSINVCQIATLFDNTNPCMTQVNQMRLGLLGCAVSHNPPVVLGPTCAEQKFALVVKLVISGLDAAWVQAHKEALFLIIKRIVAFNGGVNDANVTVTTDATSRRLLADGPLVVNAALSVENSPQADAVMAGLASGANIETLDLSSGAQAAGLGTISVQSQGVSNTITTTTTSGSTAVAAGFVSSALLAAACLAM